MSILGASGPEANYEVQVRKCIVARLGGSIFAGTVIGPAAVSEYGKEIRIVAPAAVMQGAEPVHGEVWSVTGGWATHDRYGRQLHARKVSRARPSGRLVVSYLANHVNGIGQGRAARLWKAFGVRLPEVLDKGDIAALADCIAPHAPSLSMLLAASAVTHWHEATVEPALISWLDGLGVTDLRLVRRIIKILGNQTRPTLEANPYILACVMNNWSAVDELGLRLLAEHGAVDARRDPCRLVGAVDHTVRSTITDEGHTVIDEPTLRAGVAKRLKVTSASARTDEAIRLGEINGAIIPMAADCGWRAPGCASLEESLAQRFRSLSTGQEPTKVQIPLPDTLKGRLEALQRGWAPLHEEQAAAVLHAISEPLAVLAGGAGVGKTTTVRAIVALWESLGGRVEMCALAGKAALRMSQATGKIARTIYRLLRELDKAENESEGDPEAPRLDDRTLLIVDEASMVSLGQWHKLVLAMQPGCRLLLVGDTGQLPPIGFGLVFHLLAHEEKLTAELRTIHRQAEGSGIPRVSRAIREGTVPNLPVFEGQRADGVFLLPCSKTSIPSKIEEVVSLLGGFGTDHALQIIAPVKDDRNGVGVTGINERFHEWYRKKNDISPAAILMNGGMEKEVRGHFGEYFAVGEPVIHNVNDYKRALFNGSLGHVVAIDAERRIVKARFDGDDHDFGPDSLLDISLAYCLTCHRLQGSQAERIIVVVYNHELIDPTWIYTAITRAEKQVILVGEPHALTLALARIPAWKRRRVAFSFVD